MDIKNRLQNVFWDVFEDGDIELFDEMSANDIEEWDSLTHVQLIVAVENEFKVRFKTAEIIEVKNVGEFIKTLENKLVGNK